MRRRGLIDICANILEAIHDGGDRTHIIFRARMNSEQFKRYIDGLVEGGLVKARADPRSPWAVTERGYEYVEKYRELMEFLPAHFKRGSEK